MQNIWKNFTFYQYQKKYLHNDIVINIILIIIIIIIIDVITIDFNWDYMKSMFGIKIYYYLV
jgi:hypothetical protein